MNIVYLYCTMYIPFDIVDYIANFCSATHRATMRLVCKEFSKINIGHHDKWLRLRGVLTDYNIQSGDNHIIMLVKWRSQGPIHYIPTNGHIITSCLFDGNYIRSKYYYSYGIAICRGDICKTPDIEWCTYIRCNIPEVFRLHDTIINTFDAENANNVKHDKYVISEHIYLNMMNATSEYASNMRVMQSNFDYDIKEMTIKINGLEVGNRMYEYRINCLKETIEILHSRQQTPNKMVVFIIMMACLLIAILLSIN